MYARSVNCIFPDALAKGAGGDLFETLGKGHLGYEIRCHESFLSVPVK